ncbi:MAG: CRISPR-associated CARF protein Csa3 [Nanoarchaeota archaeon]
MKRGERVVISTFYEGFAIKHIIPKLSPDKLVILIDEPKDNEKKKKMENTLTSIKEFFKGAVEIETLKISSYDIPKIISQVIKKIDIESSKGNKILVHITEGRKTTSLAVLFAAYIKKEKIEGAYYITEEEHNLIKLPILNFELNHTKKNLLKLIERGVTDINKLTSQLKIKQSAIYQNINELSKEGYIEKENGIKLTDLGKIMAV